MQNRKQYYCPNIRLILASGSPRRKKLLKEQGIPCRVVIPDISEYYRTRRPSTMVKQLALRKARAVSRTVGRGLILGADTIVVVGGKIIGKPNNAAHAYEILKIINGKINYVYTGVAFVHASSMRSWTAYEKSKVYMRNLPDKRLRSLARKNLDKAGAYAVQKKNDAFVRKVDGDYTNVVGLPIRLVKRMLKKIRKTQ